MTSDKIPAVLTFAGKQSSLSTERVLHNVMMILDKFEGDYGTVTKAELGTAIDDVRLMMQAIERG
jgi:hypothetical protein